MNAHKLLTLRYMYDNLDRKLGDRSRDATKPGLKIVAYLWK